MAKAVGIDLGTTNSVVAAVMEGGQAEVIPNAEGGRTTPSVVAFTEDGQRLVGQVAKRQAILNPEATVYSVKRFIGRKWDEVNEEAKIVSYKVVKGPNDAVRFEIRGKQYAPEEISALDPAQARRGRRQVPGRARDGGRHHRARVLQRRAAARRPRTPARSPGSRCCASSTSRPRPRWPTGSTRRARRPCWSSTSAAARSTSRCSTSATAWSRCAPSSGDGHLGGDDFDKRIVDWLADEFKRDQGIDLRQDPQALQRLYEAAERAKVELSSHDAAQINLPFITADASGPEAPQHVADAREVRAADGGPARALPRSRRGGAVGRQADGGRHRRGHPRRRLDADPGRPGARAPAHRRQGPEHDRQPRRGRRDRRRAAGGRAQGRGRGRRPARRDAAVARARDARWREDEGDRAQHDDPRAPHGGLLDRRGQPDRGRHRRPPGRARAGGRQPPACALPARGHPAGAARRAADRGHLRHRRERHPQRLGARQGHRRRAEGDDPGEHNLDQGDVEQMVRDAEQHADEDRRRREEIDARNELDSLAYRAEQLLAGAAGPAAGEREGARRAARRRRAPGDPGAGRARPGAAADRRPAAGHPRPAGVGLAPAARAATANGARRRAPASGEDEEVIDAEFTRS